METKGKQGKNKEGKSPVGLCSLTSLSLSLSLSLFFSFERLCFSLLPACLVGLRFSAAHCVRPSRSLPSQTAELQRIHPLQRVIRGDRSGSGMKKFRIHRGSYGTARYLDYRDPGCTVQHKQANRATDIVTIIRPFRKTTAACRTVRSCALCI
ncbi:hypothetical protein HOY82DRAFT_556943 [Tuber indicum]|nr:hypothetical protein HOY82DRAFT_556943 [Tuber indicum]